jgi:DNA (cytosine-5)-methyltransferase 1
MTTRIVELFHGFGGGSAAARQIGDCEVVLAADNDPYAQKVHEGWFPETQSRVSDLLDIPIQDIPDHDILIAGPPCQPFSKAGKREFFEDERSDLFLHTLNIIDQKRPKAFLIENVPGLVFEKNGFRPITPILERIVEMRYGAAWRIVSSKGWVPQNRRRTYIVGLRDLQDQHACACLDALIPPKGPTLSSIIQQGEIPKHHTISKKKMDSLLRLVEIESDRCRKFSILEPPFDHEVTRTLVANYQAEILLAQKDELPRRLTPLECHRLQGFPRNLEWAWEDDRNLLVSKTRAYRGFGNAFCVPVVADLLRELRSMTFLRIPNPEGGCRGEHQLPMKGM